MLQIFLAILAGILTIASPCILLPLPILFGSSVGQKNNIRPLFITLGFVLTFAVLGVSLNFLIQSLGLNPNILRDGAAVVLAVFALFMIWPNLFERLMFNASGLINKAGQASHRLGQGNGGGFLLGALIGVVWAPCAGPILGSILTLIARQSDMLRAAILLAAYAVGAGLPMLVVAYGGAALTTRIRSIARYAARLQQIFGVIILLLAIAIFFQYDTVIQTRLSQLFSNASDKLNSAGVVRSQSDINAGLQDQGPAPEFLGISHWLNSDPLTMKQLRGKVVLIDFWTYSCINCLRTLPYVTKWYDTYHDQGLVVVGVHTPEFAFEKVTDNIANAIKQQNIHYPVAQDNDYGTWNAYSNQFWPAEYLVDQNGHIVFTHFGEGEYDKMENAIRQLLGLNGSVAANNGQDLSGVASPEMYFGTDRLQNLTPDQDPSSTGSIYTLTDNLSLNNFALEGAWKFDADKVGLTKGPGKIKLKFHSGKAFIVAASDQPVTITPIIDGQRAQPIVIQASKLYTLFDSHDYTDHVLEIQIPDGGFQAFTFTFG